MIGLELRGFLQPVPGFLIASRPGQCERRAHRRLSGARVDLERGLVVNQRLLDVPSPRQRVGESNMRLDVVRLIFHGRREMFDRLRRSPASTPSGRRGCSGLWPPIRRRRLGGDSRTTSSNCVRARLGTSPVMNSAVPSLCCSERRSSVFSCVRSMPLLKVDAAVVQSLASSARTPRSS